MNFMPSLARSDVAGAKTTAVKKGDKWVVNGQKMCRFGMYVHRRYVDDFDHHLPQGSRMVARPTGTARRVPSG